MMGVWIFVFCVAFISKGYLISQIDKGLENELPKPYTPDVPKDMLRGLKLILPWFYIGKEYNGVKYWVINLISLLYLSLILWVLFR